MAKKKEKFNTEFQLVNMELTGIGMEIPKDFKPSLDYQFEVFLETGISEEEGQIIVKNRIEIKLGTDQQYIAYVSAKYNFEIEEFKDVIKKGKDGVYQVPQVLQLSVNTVALSTTRGLLFANFKGTVLHNAILPIIDPAQFISNQSN